MYFFLIFLLCLFTRIVCPPPIVETFTKLCPEGVGRGDKGEDLNECSFMTNPCDGGECINTDGSYRCECPAGYVLDSTGKKCVDENECKNNVNICGNGTCTNLQGGFECICADGFAPGPTQVTYTGIFNSINRSHRIPAVDERLSPTVGSSRHCGFIVELPAT